VWTQSAPDEGFSPRRQTPHPSQSCFARLIHPLPQGERGSEHHRRAIDRSIVPNPNVRLACERWLSNAIRARSASVSRSMRSTIRETSRQSAPCCSASSTCMYVIMCSSSYSVRAASVGATSATKWRHFHRRSRRECGITQSQHALYVKFKSAIPIGGADGLQHYRLVSTEAIYRKNTEVVQPPLGIRASVRLSS
jgi:hypothetical protein